MSSSKRNRRASTSEVLCATAGADNWQTWAGRSHGTDQFQFFDIFRGAKRKFNSKFVWAIPIAGTACPVCLMVPDSKHDWHLTTACGHAVCKDCLHGYASSLVRDPSHHGPLKCPVCPLPLRPKDAIAALAGDPGLIQTWDAKIRDSVLRALPGYRHCPRCSGGSATSKSENKSTINYDGSNNQSNGRIDSDDNSPPASLMGGGFVTPECLAPIHKDRESLAMAWIRHPFISKRFFTGVYLVYVYVYCGAFYSSSVYVDLVHITGIPMVCLLRLWHLGRRFVAAEARRTLNQPITVECPCCDEAFLLNAASELGNNDTVITDKATEDWIGNNTRPCPSCSVPISKIEGCNHMQCTHCRAGFCWACMRLGSSCKAFNCGNGAPYGNASSDDDAGGPRAQDENGTLDWIERMEASSPPWDNHSDGWAVVGFLLSLLTRETRVVQFAAETIITISSLLFTSGAVFAGILGFLICVMWSMLLNGRLRVQDLLDGNATEGIVEELFDVGNTVERRMIQDAMRRSMVDQ